MFLFVVFLEVVFFWGVGVLLPPPFWGSGD